MKTIVLVIYKIKIHNSKTFQSLLNICDKNKFDLNDMEIIIYDNSPDKQDFDLDLYSAMNIKYVHDDRNLGISEAYNYALAIANQNNSKWLLLLDHDTELTSSYVHSMLNHSIIDKRVVAIVPRVYFNGKLISPVFSNTLRPLESKKPDIGIIAEPIMAVNSGALIRVEFLNAIKGFSKQFPLDFLDHWLFYEIYSRGYYASVLEVDLNHDLSVMDYNNVSFNRYKSILDSEILFYREYKKDLFKVYKLQLCKRLLKQLLVVKNKKIALYTLKRLLSL